MERGEIGVEHLGASNAHHAGIGDYALALGPSEGAGHDCQERQEDGLNCRHWRKG